MASRQRGVITARQLRDLGFSQSAIDRRAATGRLHRLFRGVFLFGHALPGPWAWETAALLAAGPGPGSVISHHAAAHVHGFGEPDDHIHVTTPHRGRRSRETLRVHHADLARNETRKKHGLRLTSPARTLADLSPFLAEPTLERATDEAQALGLIPGTTCTTGRTGFTRSEAELRLKRLLHDAGLAPTATNVRINGHEVDALYEEQRLILEMDGWSTHGTRTAFERDHRRDLDHAAAGYRTVRVTWRQLEDSPLRLVAGIAAALARPRA